MTTVRIRPIRNRTDAEVSVINLAEPDNPDIKVAISGKGWEFCEIKISAL